ncbi:MAG: hypothetical protein LBS11_03885 [Oscillospiraceae bacterium]|jgi:hypothetical protein|nr:hypothetical protein [Oscillospiraceae bacterium]
MIPTGQTAGLTSRELFRRVMAFEPVERIPAIEWATWWDKTLRNWGEQGLIIPDEPPLGRGEALQRQFGLDTHAQYWVRATTDATPLAMSHGASIIEDEAGYEAILPTLYPRDSLSPERLDALRYARNRGDITWFTVDGFFWWPRSLLGIERHLFSFYDQPGLYHRICADLADFHLHVIERLCEVVTPDFMTFGEDMSYNNGPMLSEEMFDEFMLPYYRMVIPELKRRGVRVLIDSDGDITQALPWFERAGIEGILPLERQAGVDLLKLRERHPRCLFIGHFDKMVMPHGESAMRGEFERLLPVMRQGGFLPSVDHQTPPGVTLEQYLTYVKLLKEYCGKAVDA